MSELEQKRFWSRVEKSESCWNWVKSLNGYGYGRFYLNKKTLLAHRVSYELTVGEIPRGLQLDHLCRNRRCVRPDHLEPKTHKENMMAPGSQARAALNAMKTHCAKGHEYTAENTYKGKDNKRHCRACDRKRAEKYNARRKLRNMDRIK